MYGNVALESLSLIIFKGTSSSSVTIESSIPGKLVVLTDAITSSFTSSVSFTSSISFISSNTATSSTTATSSNTSSNTSCISSTTGGSVSSIINIFFVTSTSTSDASSQHRFFAVQPGKK